MILIMLLFFSVVTITNVVVYKRIISDTRDDLTQFSLNNNWYYSHIGVWFICVYVIVFVLFLYLIKRGIKKHIRQNLFKKDKFELEILKLQTVFVSGIPLKDVDG